MASAPFFPFSIWIPILDGDDEARRFFDRHYSRRRYADGRQPKLFVGPGEKMVLTTPCRRALFVWRKFISGDGQQGINCAVFRNEGAGLSSSLIREADKLADTRWPGERHYTYVNPRAVESSNPGFCFMQAGWRKCGVTKRNKLIILERRHLMAKQIDITSEEYRVYTYADGSTFRIDSPATLHIIEDEKGVTHRVVDRNGVTHRPERGFIGISWKPANGQPAFVA